MGGRSCTLGLALEHVVQKPWGLDMHGISASWGAGRRRGSPLSVTAK